MLVPCPTKALNQGLMLILALCTASSLLVQSAPVQSSQPPAAGNSPPLGPADSANPNGGRTIIVGDVHGRLEDFNKLIAELKYNQTMDKVILAGDLVAKGPDSLGVIDKARQMGAECVRGNHDDEVLRWRGYLDSLKKTTKTDFKNEEEDEAKVPEDLIPGSEHEKLARDMTDAQYKYLSSCPLILTLPDTLSPRNAAVYVMHAGIDPAHTFKEQKPWTLFNVRNILDGVPSRKKKGSSWSKGYNEAESKRVQKGAEGHLVVYGHDAGRGLNNQKWSIGLDTGCVKGNQLSAYIVEQDKVVSIDCGKASEGDDGDD
ncbi:hypothetical protein BGZ70_005263 [Mortierella alpina]|uniref:Calcineurin-like phosphoesterase domain-containing protein n=1 Tax=Mortierella alpina TaxID=64518 RepID=A0A9P6J904_MORAP|nr:hypothetical protein BGZ70_005263 [Mortierella alpina]